MAVYCINCGNALEQRPAFGAVRGVCPSCGHVHFEDPKVAVGVVLELGGRLVLCQRNHEPMLGGWSFPSGFVDAGEVLEVAAAREALEETGLEARIDELLGAYSSEGERTVFIAYAATAVGGEIVVGEECMAVEAFAPDALPELAFPHDPAVLSAWHAARHPLAGGTPT